jgi:hypothetical protein
MKRSGTLPEFHPQTLLRDWGGGEGFRIADAVTGVFICGGTGSGKSTGPGRSLSYAYLAAGFGGLVLCAKPGEAEDWKKCAKETDRSDDLVLIDASGTYRFNFMDWEESHAENGGGLNIVALLDEIAGAVAGETGKEGGDNKFWEQALHLMNANLVDLCLLAGLRVSLPLLHSILSSAPQSLEELSDPKWQETSTCAAILNEADEATRKGDPEIRADFEECATYWRFGFPGLSEKTRSIIVLSFSMLARPFTTRPLRKLFSSDTNITPEATFGGKVIVVNLPVQSWRLIGRFAGLAWKFCFQVAVLRRTAPIKKNTFLRPVFLWADEAQNFITRFDAMYVAVARSAGGATVFLVQNRESFRHVLGNNDAVDSLLGNLQAKFFCQGSGETNEWASRLLGERWVESVSTSINTNVNDGVGARPESRKSASAGVTRGPQQRRFVEPSAFTTLKRGGERNDFKVECIVYLGGNEFAGPDGELLPYKLLTFDQR